MEQNSQNGSQGQTGNVPGQPQPQGQNPAMLLAQRNAAMSQLTSQKPYSAFIRPDQFTMANFGATNLNQSQLDAYKNGFTKLWDNVIKYPTEHPNHQQAIQKLSEASTKLYREYHRVKAEKNNQGAAVGQALQANANTNLEDQKDIKPSVGGNQQQPKPTAQSQPQPQQQQQQQQQQRQQNQVQAGPQQGTNQTAAAPNGQQRQEIPPEIKAQAEKMVWTKPVHIQEGSEEAQTWRNEITRRYCECLYKRNRSSQVIRECDEFIRLAKEKGTDYSQAEERKATYQKHYQEATMFMERLVTNEKKNREDAAKIRQGQMGQAPQAQPQQPQAPPSAQPQRNGAVTTPVSAGGMQQNRTPASSTAPSLPAQAFPQTIGQAVQQGQQQGPGTQGFQPQRPPPQPIHTSQQTSMQNNTTQSPTPLSHSQAIAASSRSYSTQQAVPPQSAQHIRQHGGSISGDIDTRAPMQPIQKNWTPQPPQPVPMGPARPTLSGANSGPVGAMGQPAIQKPDTFLLQGPGDRVLDKKKLDELVRQVCGADAGEGDTLLPEVEELADEFIDNVVTSACKLAKLRGATTLEIRDIQLVLERQYNIRVPGYATDEVRTVRKIQPAQGYYQKMNAIQAAKVMGGKADG